MAFFKNNFWGEKNAGFDVLYHNMKHGQLATKELAEFVRERAAIEETYSKSMSKLAKIASNGSSLGTFAPLWDVFRVSSDKLALCHLELMRKMNSLINDINKYGEEQVKIHRKTKEEVMGTLEAVQTLQAQSSQLQKSRENYHSKCVELDRLRREGAPQKELEKAEVKSKKAAESFSSCVEKYNRVGGDFEQKMTESAQKFQDLEETHLRQMKHLIKAYSHSIEDTHVQVGQVHEEFKQNVENIGIENLIKKFAEQKGTGTDRPAPVGFEEYSSSGAPEGGKKSRAKAFRIPGLGKRDKEPDSTDTAVTEAPNSPQVDEEGFVIRADVNQNGCSQDKDGSFYSSDSDFDDDEPKKFNIQIRPVGTSGRSHAPAEELRATVGALTLPPNRGVSIKRHLSRSSSRTAGARSEGEGDGAPHRDGEKEGLRRSTSSPDHSRLTSTVSAPEKLFGPPLDSAFKPNNFADAAFSSDSSSPENVEDSGLDSPSHQPLGPSPEPTAWAAWPMATQSRESASLGRASDPFLTAFRDPSPGRTPPAQDDPATMWATTPRSPRPMPDMDPSFFGFPAFGRPLAPAELEPPMWSCKHIPPEDPFLAAFERTTAPEPAASPEPWAPARPRLTRDGRGLDGRGDPFSVSHGDSKTATTSSSSSSQKERDRGAPILESPEDPFSITMIGSPSHQSSLAAAAVAQSSTSNSGSSRLAPSSSSGPTSSHGPRPRKELVRWNSVHNPFSEATMGAAPAGAGGGRDGARKQRASEGAPRRKGLPLTRHSGPQEDLCFSTDNDQNCLSLGTQPPHTGDTPPPSRRDSAEMLLAAPPRPSRARRVSAGRQGACERSRSLCSSPLPGPSPPLTSSSSSSSSPSEWGGQTSTPRAPSPARAGLSRGPSPISLSTQEAWPVAAAITEYINAYFKGGEHNRCLVKITGDLTMSFPAGISRIFTANPNAPVLSFRLVNIARVDHFLPNQKLLYSDPSQSDPDTRDFWFNMQALNVYLQREAELNPGASYYNVTLLKYQVSSQDPGSAPLLLSAECQRSGTVTRVSLDYHCCPATAPAAQLTGVQVLMALDHTATDLQCQPPATWNAEERRLLWKLPNLSPTNHSKGSGTLCASWQCLEVPRGPPPSLLVQFVGSGASLSGMDVQLVGNRYRMSLVKKRFATGKYMAGCSM
ncbi:F-BAR domain only protein 1-like [Megalops cyprinoides]|uniref:F-BAR domain only protein 1-like n=1 Tax=Megalops cyprinoides TaxID=118141 RepID=UPI001864A8E6|nr:F-BAR domain only protein 1-like [Megalops cyprinoides]